MNELFPLARMFPIGVMHNPRPFDAKYLMSTFLEWGALFSLKRGTHLKNLLTVFAHLKIT